MSKEKRASRGIGKFFLGWFVGFIFTIGLIAGFGFWFYKNGTVHGIEKTFGLELSFLDDKSKNMTIDKLIGKVINVASNYNDMSLEEISDTVGLNLESILTVVDNGGTKQYKYKDIDVTKVVTGDIKDISTNFQSVIDGVSLGQLESSFGISLPDIELLNSAKNAPMSGLQSALTDAFQDYTLNKISEDFGVSFSGVTVLESLLDTPISQLGEEIEDLKVEDVFDITDPDAPKFIKSLEGKRVLDIADEIADMPLKNIIESSDNKILTALENATMNNLDARIKELKVSQVFETSGNKFLEAIADEYILEIDQAFDELKISAIIDVEKELNPSYNPATDKSYKQYKPQGVWAYIDTNGLLTSLESQVDNLSFEDKTLGELQYQGLISATADLNKTVTGSGSDKLLSDYTLSELIDVL